MVRYAGADGRLTDAVGDLLAWRGGQLVVRTRSGSVTVRQADVVAGKPVPEPRLRHAGEASVAQLTRIAARARPPAESAWLGGWLLRVGEPAWLAGTVLPLGEPADESLDGTLAAVAAWYRARGAAAAVHLAGPEAVELDGALAHRGWPATAGHAVLVADVPGAPPMSPQAERQEPAETAAVDGRPPAPVQGDWAVLDGLDAAGSGAALRQEATAALRRAAGQGARHALARVRAEDEAAARMITEVLAGLGFAEHHRCHLRQAP